MVVRTEEAAKVEKVEKPVPAELQATNEMESGAPLALAREEKEAKTARKGRKAIPARMGRSLRMRCR
jgi:hypothetical protein